MIRILANDEKKMKIDFQVQDICKWCNTHDEAHGATLLVWWKYMEWKFPMLKYNIWLAVYKN